MKALNDDGDELKRAKAKTKGDKEALNDDVKVCKGGKKAVKGDADAFNGDGKAPKSDEFKQWGGAKGRLRFVQK